MNFHRIKDKKRWFAANFCTPHVKCAETPMTGMLLGLGMVGLLIAGVALMALAVSMPAAATSLAIVVPTATVGRSKQLIEKENEIKIKREALEKIFDEAKTADGYDFNKVKCLGDGMNSASVADKVRAANEELKDLGKDRDRIAEMDQIASDLRNSETKAGVSRGMHSEPTDSARGQQEKSFGELFTESEAYTGRNTKATAELNIGIKTLFERGAGWEPESVRSGLVVPYPVRPIQVMQLLPSIPTSQDAYKYMEHTTLDESAVVEKSEGAAFGEAEFALTQRTVIVEKIPAWVPVTEEQLADVAGAQAFLNNQLPATVMRRLDYQILNGDGNSPNLKGILNIGAGLQTQAKGTDDVITAFRKAMTKIMVTGQALPTAAVMHPNDWQDIVTIKTTDGIFIWGNPSQVSVERIWGLQVAQAQAIAENTGLVGAFADYSMLVERQGMDVQVGMVNDDFIKGKKAVRATVRVAIVWLRPSAFCTVTGI
jgi:HK97 family phage major capsid protein